MSLKNAWLVIAAALSLLLAPIAAFAAEGPAPEMGGAPSSESGYVTTRADEAPAISLIAVHGRSITVSGSSFGATRGSSSVRVFRAGLGNAGAGMDASVTSWSATMVQLVLAAEPTGIIGVEVTTPSGTAQASKYVTPGPNVYEKTLALPRSFLPEGYVGALPSSGVLKGWDRYLYYLREVPTSAAGSAFAFHAFDRYSVDGGGWEALADLPEWLAYCSGAVIDGDFVVAGVAYDTSANEPTGEERMYLYDIGQKAWMRLDAAGVPLGAGIVNLDGQLMVVGGADGNWGFTSAVYEYDLATGIGLRVANLTVPVFNPQLAVHAGQVFVYSYGTSLAEYNGGGAQRHLQVLFEGTTRLVGGVFPSFIAADAGAGMPPRAEMIGAIAAATEGLMLVGPANLEGTADTYLLDWNLNGKGFLPYYTRASDARLYGAAACVHNDRFYVAAASEIEPSNLVFRATGVLAPTVERGNNAVWRQGSEKPLEISFTPDLSRFDGQVFVDAKELVIDSDFTATYGSTVIELDPDYLSGLSLGSHEMVVDFDGGGASVSVNFTVESAADPLEQDMRQGRSQPAATARTGDVLLAVPFIVVGLGALGLMAYLVRRRGRNG